MSDWTPLTRFFCAMLLSLASFSLSRRALWRAFRRDSVSSRLIPFSVRFVEN